MGGALAEDVENMFAEDIDWTLRQLEFEGGAETNIYRDMPKVEDGHMAKDRRQLALDRAQAEQSFQKFYPQASRLDGDMVSTCYGDQAEPVLAMDERSSDAAAEAARWFGLDRIGQG